MMKYTICVLIGIALSNPSFSQSAGSYLYSNQASQADHVNIPVNMPSGNTVSLKAEVMMNVRATSYTAIFAATQSGRDAWECDSLMFQRIGQIKYALGIMGISEKDIHIDAVATVPSYTQKLEEKRFSKRATEIPVGFEMKKNIHILFRDHDLLDEIISEMAFADIYDLVKVEYNIDGVQSYYEELRNAAMSVIRTKETTYTNLKLHLTSYSIADGFTSVYPMERYEAYTAYNTGTTYHAVTAALQQNQMVIVEGKNARVNFEKPYGEQLNQQFIIQTSEKNKTIFYDRVPYNQFDKVLNADTEEPCIQLMYNLQVYYTMLTDEQHQAKEQQLLLQKKAQEEALNTKGRKNRRRAG
jgi:uncharacterized protein YggE